MNRAAQDFSAISARRCASKADHALFGFKIQIGVEESEVGFLLTLRLENVTLLFIQEPNSDRQPRGSF
jgi:hypothetical protein